MLGPKDSNDLKSVSEFNSVWADRVAYLILVGLLVDIADLFTSEGRWKIGVSIGANLLIFGGVWGELWFAKRAREADDGRVAEANARAAEATLQVARLRAPRVLNPEQRSRISEKMRQFGGPRVSVGAIPQSFEATTLAEQIVRVLLDAGIQAHSNQGGAEVHIGPAHGVVARTTTGNDLGEAFVAAFAAAMTDEGISTAAMGGLFETGIFETMMKGAAQQGLARTDGRFQQVVIVVGDKI
jgi:hypothetical protein